MIRSIPILAVVLLIGCAPIRPPRQSTDASVNVSSSIERASVRGEVVQTDIDGLKKYLRGFGLELWQRAMADSKALATEHKNAQADIEDYRKQMAGKDSAIDKMLEKIAALSAQIARYQKQWGLTDRTWFWLKMAFGTWAVLGIASWALRAYFKPGTWMFTIGKVLAGVLPFATPFNAAAHLVQPTTTVALSPAPKQADLFPDTMVA